MSRSRVLLSGVLAAASLVAALPALASPPGGMPPGRAKKACTDKTDDALPLGLPVGGGTATGLYGFPSAPPTDLVVFAHGYGHTSQSWAHHIRRTAREHGAAAVAMDYRGLKIIPDSDGDGLPQSRGWNARAGAADLVAAAQHFERICPSIETITIFGVSMGANMSGLAVANAAEARRSDGSPLFDYWFDIEGAVNVVETYAGARALAPVNAFAKNAQEDIEAEMGGPIESKPQAYADRAVVTHIDEIKASGVKGVVLVHGLDDGLVPYNQSREMSSLLLSRQINYDFFTVGRRSPQSEKETTATGYVGDQVVAQTPGDDKYVSPLAGHASEKSTTHIIMVTAFDRLASLLEDREAPGMYREYFVDGELGTFGPTL